MNRSFLAFQLGSGALLLLASSGRPGLAVPVGLAALGVQVAWATDRRGTAVCGAAGALLGLAAESLLHGAGFARFAAGGGAWLCPPWVALFWACLAAAAPSWPSLMARPVAAALVGGALSPLAFLSSARGGILTVGEPLAGSLAAIAAATGAALWGVLVAARHAASVARS